ncbi:MAG: exodeoxyribonuclease VII small subunit [Candidatus Saccharimonadales bacterium]
MSKANEPTLSQQLAQLDDIVAWFEQDDFDMEEAIAKFEEGSALAVSIRAKLATLENKITVLKQSFDE